MIRKVSIALALAASLIVAPHIVVEAAAPKKESEEQADAVRGLPPEVVTTHSVTLAGEKIGFSARAGAVRLRDAQTGAPRADVAFVSYERAEADPLTRPVVFVFNGGPGAASAWLGLGGLSPWRLAVGSRLSPSAPPLVTDNAESWLAFADLVFVDPPGTGYSKFLADGDEIKKQFFSTRGDAEALAVVLRKWLAAHRRSASPKYLVGESYGGFRIVKLARALRERESVGVDGLLMISPVLDFSWLEGSRNLLSYAAYLPSFAAVARAAEDRAALADAEAYAAGEFVADLLKGAQDRDALARLAANVARLSGLERQTVERAGGRIDVRNFVRNRRRDAEQLLSAYDGDVAGFDPAPFSQDRDWADPVLDTLRTPLGAAMSRVVSERLAWPIGDARYEILNDSVAHDWDFGRGGRLNAEAVSDLRQALALDPRLKVLVVHGLTDLVTPYFATKLLLDQLPAYGEASRIRFVTLPGGHMSYIRDESRKLLRDAARSTIERR